jgi:hypothetical protein
MIVASMSKKLVLRYRGKGAKPAGAVARVEALAGAMSDWVVSAERTVKLPSPRPQVRSKRAA